MLTIMVSSINRIVNIVKCKVYIIYCIILIHVEFMNLNVSKVSDTMLTITERAFCNAAVQHACKLLKSIGSFFPLEKQVIQQRISISHAGFLPLVNL